MQKRRSKMKCYICGQEGHVRRECPGIPDGGRGASHHPVKYRNSKRKAGRNEEAPEQDEVAITPSLPYSDACCRLHLMFKAFGHPGDYDQFKNKIQSSATPITEDLQSCVAFFDDSKALLPEGGDRSYRIWERAFDPETDSVFMGFGLAPKECPRYFNHEVLERLEEYITNDRVVALGVVGLDFRGCTEADKDVQVEAMTAQVQLAVSLDLPIVLSCFEADQEMTDVLLGTCRGETLLLLLDGSPSLHFGLRKRFPKLYSGFTGSVTFSKSKHLLEAVYDCPLDRLILYSGAPAKVPSHLTSELQHSHPGVIPTIAAKVAEIRMCDVGEVMEAADQNFQRFYSLQGNPQ